LASDGRQTSPPAVVPILLANILTASWLAKTAGFFSQLWNAVEGSEREEAVKFQLTGKLKSRCSCRSLTRPSTITPTAPSVCARRDMSPP
jgi:hypothetical protein